MKVLTFALAVGAAGLCASSVQGQLPEPRRSFTDRIEVTAVDVMIEVVDRKGETPDDLTAEDFEVLEDGNPVPVIGLDYPAPRVRVQPTRELTEHPTEPTRVQEAWRFLIYFENALTSQYSLRKAVKELARRVDELTEMGSVEVVVADPAPEIVQSFTRDPEVLRGSLDAVAPRRRASELAELRRDFLRQRDLWITVSNNPGAVNSAQAVGQIRAALQEEQDLVERQLERFRLWLDAYGSLPASAVILVTDGFDVDPSEFYLQATSAPGLERELIAELRQYEFAKSNERLSHELSARGWTGIVLAIGGSSAADMPGDASMAGRERFRSIGELGSAGPSSASVTSLLQRPTEPLELLAQESGGEVLVSLRKTEDALQRLGRRLRLTYQANRPSDGKRRRLEVRVRRPGLEVRVPRWTSSPTSAETAVSLARRLLVIGEPAGEVPVEVRRGDPEAGDKGGVKRTRLTILFDLSDLRAVLPGPRFPVRFTISVALAEETSFVHQMIQAVELPPGVDTDAGGELPRFNLTVYLDLPPKAGRIGVLVEEPSTGSWGGNVADL